MIKIVYCIRRKPSLSHEEFLAYWKNVHAPMVVEHQATLRIARYVQTEPVDHPLSARVERRQSLQEPYDGVAELFWATEEDLRHALQDDEAKRVQRILAADENHFIDHSRSARWIAAETTPI